MCIYGRLLSVYLVADRRLNRAMETTCFDPSVSTYLYVKPFGLEPASVAIATNGLKGYFPFKGLTTVGSGGEVAPITSYSTS